MRNQNAKHATRSTDARMNRHRGEDANLPPLWRDWRFYAVILLALFLGALAYQVRLPAWIDIGALGDRAYLWASPLQSDVGFNGDGFAGYGRKA